jgi:hypothetical protein
MAKTALPLSVAAPAKTSFRAFFNHSALRGQRGDQAR